MRPIIAFDVTDRMIHIEYTYTFLYAVSAQLSVVALIEGRGRGEVIDVVGSRLQFGGTRLCKQTWKTSLCLGE
jgi:hypothetical protein